PTTSTATSFVARSRLTRRKRRLRHQYSVAAETPRRRANSPTPRPLRSCSRISARHRFSACPPFLAAIGHLQAAIVPGYAAVNQMHLAGRLRKSRVPRGGHGRHRNRGGDEV